MSKGTEIQTKFERSAHVFMLFVCAISLLAVIGWLFNQPILASLRPEYIPMAPATALILLGLCGTWFIYRVFPAKRWIRILVQAGLAGMLIIVLLLALNYFIGLGPDLEQMLYPDPTFLGNIITARMSPLTALGFFLVIPAFLLMTRHRPGRLIRTAAASLALVVFILSSVNSIGYLYGAPLFYGGTLIPVAITTTLSFLFLCLGLLMIVGPTCWPVRIFMGPSLKARLMRAFIPASILIVMIQGLLASASATWIVNPAIRVAGAVIVTTATVLILISLLANDVSADVERNYQARLKVESALKQSEARFRSIAETANDAIINIDHNGQIVFWNRIAERIFGYSAGEAIGKPLDMVMPERFQGSHQKGLQRVVLTEESHILGTTVEVTGLRRDGSEFPMELSLASWQVAGDVFFTGIARDITERKHAEQLLYESESRFRAIFEQAAIGVAQINSTTGEFVRVNQKYCDIFGYSSVDLLRMRFQEISHPDDLQGDLELMQKLLSSEIPSFTIEKRHYRSDKSIVWLNVTVSPMWNPGEQPDYHVAVIEDITERKRFESVRNAIFRITQAAMASGGIDALYKTIHSILGELIPAENFYIALYDPVTRLISFPYYIDQFDEPPPAPTPLQGLTGYVIRSGIPLLAPLEVFNRLVRQGEVEALGTTSEDWMGAPLKVERRIIGVMVVQSYTDGIHFDQEDLNIFEFVSTQVAQAIERKRLEEEIRDLSLTDELTGLYNRRGFTLLADQEMKLAQRFKRNVLLFFCDVDDLKTINDTLGHAQGDLALKDVASIIKGCFRAADIPARFGGDEFVVLAPDSSIENADIITDRLRAALMKRNQGDRPYQLALSMGVARYDPEAPCTVKDLIAQADDMMYHQKQAKKGKK